MYTDTTLERKEEKKLYLIVQAKIEQPFIDIISLCRLWCHHTKDVMRQSYFI